MKQVKKLRSEASKKLRSEASKETKKTSKQGRREEVELRSHVVASVCFWLLQLVVVVYC